MAKLTARCLPLVALCAACSSMGPSSACADASAEHPECRVRPAAAMPVAGEPAGEFDPLQLDASSLVFSETFDTQDDFFLPYAGASCVRGVRDECALVPEGWTHFYSAERWHPQSDGDSAVHSSLEISDFQKRGPSGKGLVVWDESWGGPSQWGSDGVLAHRLPEEFSDLYAEFHIKFQPGFRWHHYEAGSGTNLAKIFRLSHFDGDDGNPFKFFSNGDSAPTYFLDLHMWNTQKNGATLNFTSLASNVRCDPQESNYRCGSYESNTRGALPGQRSFEESIGDGAWHHIGVRVSVNSAPGVPDGVVSVWFDGEQVEHRTDVPFLGEGAPAGSGWNFAMLAGNMHNYPEPEESRLEQWYAIDDFKLYRVD